MILLYILICLFSWFDFSVTANRDHDLFQRQAHFYVLGIQIEHMYDKLYEHCPKVFQTPDKSSVAIIGQRTVDTSLDLKIELAEKTLEKFITKFGNCTSTTPIMTSPTSTETAMQTTSKETNILPTSSQPITTPTSPTTHLLYTTTNRHQHAFQVLHSKNVTYKGYDFLALQLRVPADGLSKSFNWCYDYQYLCSDFQRRPIGCSAFWSNDSITLDCRDNYNADMNTGDTFGCNPSRGIANLANFAFPNLSPPAHPGNAFGFARCQYCNKTLQGSDLALQYIGTVYNFDAATLYTVCR